MNPLSLDQGSGGHRAAAGSTPPRPPWCPTGGGGAAGRSSRTAPGGCPPAGTRRASPSTARLRHGHGHGRGHGREGAAGPEPLHAGEGRGWLMPLFLKCRVPLLRGWNTRVSGRLWAVPFVSTKPGVLPQRSTCRNTPRVSSSGSRAVERSWPVACQ